MDQGRPLVKAVGDQEALPVDLAVLAVAVPMEL